MLAGRAVDLGRLKDELVAAGIAVADLRNTAGDLRELKADGTTTDLPAGARAVIDAHVGPDVLTAERTAASADIKAKAQAASAILDRTSNDMDTVLANVDTATLAQARAGLKLVATDLKALLPLFRALGRSAVDQAGS